MPQPSVDCLESLLSALVNALRGAQCRVSAVGPIHSRSVVIVDHSIEGISKSTPVTRLSVVEEQQSTSQTVVVLRFEPLILKCCPLSLTLPSIAEKQFDLGLEIRSEEAFGGSLKALTFPDLRPVLVCSLFRYLPIVDQSTQTITASLSSGVQKPTHHQSYAHAFASVLHPWHSTLTYSEDVGAWAVLHILDDVSERDCWASFLRPIEDLVSYAEILDPSFEAPDRRQSCEDRTLKLVKQADALLKSKLSSFAASLEVLETPPEPSIVVVFQPASRLSMDVPLPAIVCENERPVKCDTPKANVRSDNAARNAHVRAAPDRKTAGKRKVAAFHTNP